MDAKEQPDKQPHNLTAHGVGAGAAARERPRQQEAPARQREAPQRETTQRGSDVRQPANVKKPIHGATVGMAINQANSILLRLHADDAAYFSSPQYSKDLGELASDIVRVSQYMESGHLAPSAKSRAKADQQASDAPTGQETRPARQPQQFVVEGYGPEDSKQGGCPDQRDVSSFKEDIESDDIPW